VALPQKEINMSTQKLTVTEALVKLKLTEKKLSHVTTNLFVGLNTTRGAKALPHNFKNVEDAKAHAQAQLDSVSGLLTYRNKLKEAIVTSNANTSVTVGNTSMTVAQAIEQKQSVKHKKELLAKLERDFVGLTGNAERHNAQLDRQVDDYLAKIFVGKETNSDETARQTARKNWLEANTMLVVAPDNVKDVIERLRSSLEDFESNVDVALSVVNAQTFISINT
jgi:hypothetical protein